MSPTRPAIPSEDREGPNAAPAAILLLRNRNSFRVRFMKFSPPSAAVSKKHIPRSPSPARRGHGIHCSILLTCSTRLHTLIAMASTDLFQALTALPRSSTVDRVAERLRDLLLSGDFAPGTSLQEIPLANALGVSRNTLREAARTLVAEGLLSRTPHKGIVVPGLTPDDVKELFEIRELLELAALERACAQPNKILPDLQDKVEDF